MIHPVRIFDAAGNLKREISSETLSRRFWRNVKKEDEIRRKTRMPGRRPKLLIVSEAAYDYDTCQFEYQEALRSRTPEMI